MDSGNRPSRCEFCARNSQREGRSLPRQGRDHLSQWDVGISVEFSTETTDSYVIPRSGVPRHKHMLPPEWIRSGGIDQPKWIWIFWVSNMRGGYVNYNKGIISPPSSPPLPNHRFLFSALHLSRVARWEMLSRAKLIFRQIVNYRAKHFKPGHRNTHDQKNFKRPNQPGMTIINIFFEERLHLH